MKKVISEYTLSFRLPTIVSGFISVICVAFVVGVVFSDKTSAVTNNAMNIKTNAENLTTHLDECKMQTKEDAEKLAKIPVLEETIKNINNSMENTNKLLRDLIQLHQSN